MTPPIVILAPNLNRALQFGGGGETHLARLGSRLLADGYPVQFIAYKRGWQVAPGHQAIEVDQQAVEVRLLPLIPIRLLGTLLFILFVIADFARRRPSIVLIHSAHLNMVFLGWLAKLLRHRTIAYTIGDDLRILRARQPGLVKHLHRRLIHQQDYVIPLSQDMKHVLEQHATPDRKLRLIPNGLDVAHFRPITDADEQRALRQRLHLPGDAWLLAIVARLDVIKRHDILLEAFAALHHNHAHTTLLLIGDGPQKPHLVQQTHQLALADAVIFAGYQRNTHEYLRASDAFVLASDAEGHSNALIEAMATGLPIVATHVGGNADCITHEKSGLLVPRRDPQAMAAALQRLVENPTYAQQLGQHARAIATERYSLAREVAAYQQLFTQFDTHITA